MTDQKRIVAFTTKTKGQVPRGIMEVLDLMARRRGHRNFTLTFSDLQYEVIEGNKAEPNYAGMSYLCTDGAAELMQKELTDWCRSVGITPLASSSYTPAQNEAENIVKIVSQGVDAIMRQFGGPRRFYTRAIDHFCMTDELLPHDRPLGAFRTPFEAFLQTKVPWKQLLKGLQPFGCKAYLHIPRSLRAHTHGCSKAVLGYNMGFSKRKKGYVFLTASGHKIIDGVWDVFFVPNSFPCAEERARVARIVDAKRHQEHSNEGSEGTIEALGAEEAANQERSHDREA